MQTSEAQRAVPGTFEARSVRELRPEKKRISQGKLSWSNVYNSSFLFLEDASRKNDGTS